MGIPVCPEILGWSWWVCQLLFKVIISYLLSSWASHTLLYPQSPHPYLFTANSTNLPGPASISLPSILLPWNKGPSYQSPTAPLVLKIPTLFMFKINVFSHLNQFPFIGSFLTSNKYVINSYLKKKVSLITKSPIFSIQFFHSPPKKNLKWLSTDTASLHLPFSPLPISICLPQPPFHSNAAPV